MTYSTAEMIETIVTRKASGTFGTYKPGLGAHSYVTLADGREFTVWLDTQHWHVKDHATGFEGVADTVLDAAHFALNP